MNFKRLTRDNWLMVDPDGSFFVSVNHEDGTISRTSGEQWLEAFMRPRLLDDVPQEVRDLFDIARSSMVYGHFFYPLFTLGAEQILRAGETGIRLRYEQLGGPKKNKTFETRLLWMREHKHISQWDFEDWNIVRKGRNYTSHPDSAQKATPGMVGGIVERIARHLNKLFTGEAKI